MFGPVRDLQRWLSGIRGILPASHGTLTKIEGYGSGLHRRPSSHPQPSGNSKNYNRSRGQPYLNPASPHRSMLSELREFLKAWAARAQMLEPRLQFCQGHSALRDAVE